MREIAEAMFQLGRIYGKLEALQEKTDKLKRKADELEIHRTRLDS